MSHFYRNNQLEEGKFFPYVEMRKALHYHHKNRPQHFVPDPTEYTRGYLLEVDQPIYHAKYGATDMLDGMRVMEYVRYIRVRDRLKERDEGTGEFSFPKPPPDVFRIRARRDSSFDPATAPSKQTISGTHNIHLLIDLLIYGNCDFNKDPKEFEELPQSAKFELYFDAALALMDLVTDLNRKTRDICVISTKYGSQSSNRKVNIVLWRALATHIRYMFRTSRVNIKWPALKFIADHHPRALLKKYLRPTETEAYYPEIKAEEVTFIDMSDRKKTGLRYVKNPEHYKGLTDYIYWLRTNFPTGRPRKLTRNAEGLYDRDENMRGCIVRRLKDLPVLLDELRRHIKGGNHPLRHYDTQMLLDHVDLLGAEFWRTAGIIDFSRRLGVSPWHSCEQMSNTMDGKKLPYEQEALRYAGKKQDQPVEIKEVIEPKVIPFPSSGKPDWYFDADPGERADYDNCAKNPKEFKEVFPHVDFDAFTEWLGGASQHKVFFVDNASLEGQQEVVDEFLAECDNI